ncbi:hypothetical protein [Chitinimonas sp.]|uniref:hypothetical protein n=1 Tax=Chitinimonas sp. TaxID=1934313 RepID=UPI0035AEAC8A
MADSQQAALLLHGLAPSDRDWLLNQLDPAMQAELNAHLQELQALGIPADPALIDAALKQADAGARHSATAARMQALLAEEPLWLVAQILALPGCTWRDAYLAAQSLERRQRLLRHTATPAGPALTRALQAALAQRLQQRMVEP